MYKSVITLALFLLSLNMSSQERKDKLNFNNQIGLVITDLVNGSYLFQYERYLGKHFSVSLGLGYKTDDGLVRLSGIDRDRIKTDDLTYSGFKLIPEVRYYLKKTMLNTMDGFYFGAYLKYSGLNSDLNGSYFNRSNKEYDVEFDADLNITSIGLLVGYKLRLSKHFTIDFLIAGPGSGSYRFSIVEKKPLPEEFYEDFNDALNNYSIFDFIDSDFRFSKLDEKSTFSTISFRYAVTVGYSF